MPFYRLQSARYAAAAKLAPDMPLPLEVSINDKDRERDGLTTAVLVQGFRYVDEIEKLDIPVPTGFTTDFASIPSWARAVIPPFGRHAKAAVVHDWLYAIGEPGRKPVADRVFDHAMAELGVVGWQRVSMYAAVVAGGGGGYARAATDWLDSFGDPISGQHVEAPYARETAFLGQPNGPKPLP
jgi:hypothetical protein